MPEHSEHSGRTNSRWGLVAGILAIAVAVAWGVDYSFNRQANERIGQHIFESETFAKVDKIEIQKNNSQIDLSAAGKAWHLTADNFPVDAQKVMALMKAVTSGTLERVVARSRQGFADLGLDTGASLKLFAGADVLLNIHIGKERPTGGCYISLNDESLAYLFAQNIAADVAPAAWEYRTLLNIKAEQIRAVEFAPAGRAQPVHVERAKVEEHFQLTGVKPAETVQDGVLAATASILENVTAERRVKKGAAEVDGLEPVETVHVSLFDGRTAEATLLQKGGAKKKDDAAAKTTWLRLSISGPEEDMKRLAGLMDQWEFQVSESTAGRFLKTRDAFVALKTLPQKRVGPPPARPLNNKK